MLRTANFRRVSQICYTYIEICNSTNQREGYFHGKRTASRASFNLSKCNSWQGKPRLPDRTGSRAAHRGRQAEPLWASGRHGHLGCLPLRPQSLRGGCAALGRHRPRHRAIACAQGQGRGCQRASYIGPGKPSIAQAPARSTNDTLRLHLGTSRSAFAAGYQRMVARAGVAAKFTFPVHSHMLRHACGFKLANDGHDTRAIQAYLGHRSNMSTVRYTALTPNRFKSFWKD
jgi:Phage integrase family